MTDYTASISQAFNRNYLPGASVVPFRRDDLFVDGVQIKNIGDVPHAIKVGRSFLPEDIDQLAPAGHRWAILGAGKGLYQFLPVRQAYYFPDLSLPVLSIPDLSLGSCLGGRLDEQGIVSHANRNNLFGAFLAVRLEHFQPHRRMFVEHIGQVEVDDVSIGTDPLTGENVMVPICAKRDDARGNALLGWSQLKQDILACQQLRPNLRVRPVGMIALDDRLCLFEFAEQGNEIAVVDERHYSWSI
jgi:hypothetical protein